MSAAMFSVHAGTLGQPKDVAFKADIDGSEQYYMEILPSDFDQDKKYDLIIGLHGHGSDRRQFATDKRPECSSFRDFAAKYGMIAVTPDYRAKTSWMGPKAEADVVQLIGDLKKKYKIDRVFLVGGSMGGTSVLTFAVLHPDMVDGVTSMNGLANHLEYDKFQDAIAASFGGTKDKAPDEYKKRSAEFFPKKLTMPVAFTISDNDTIVPPDSVKRLAASLEKLKRKVLVVNRPKGGHGTNYEDGMEAMEFMISSTGKTKTAGKGKSNAPVSVNKPSEPEEKAQKTNTEQEKVQTDTTAIVVDSVSVPGKGIFFADAQPAENDAKGKVELGLKLYVEKAGKIKAFCFYQAKSESGPHVFHLWSTDGKLLLTVNASEAQGLGWISIPLSKPHDVAASTELILSYTCNSNYVGTADVFKNPVKKDGIMAVAGLYSFTDLGQKAPDKTYKDMNYFLDVEFE